VDLVTVEREMKKLSLVVGIACFLVAATIFVFADGPRRIYSGVLFIVLGVVSVAGVRRGR
jgi:hypothetical protein